MRNERGLTLLDVVVTIFVIIAVLAVLVYMLGKIKNRALYAVCGTNLKGLGTAQVVYANDYDDEFAIQGGTGRPLWSTGTDGFDDPDKDWKYSERITVGASLYLLVREADVSPKSFVCPYGTQKAYECENSSGLEPYDLWDFGMYTSEPVKGEDVGIGNIHGPRNHVSYSYQMPYGPDGGKGEFAADTTVSAAFAVMADKNPWFDPKLKTGTTNIKNWHDYVGPMGAYYSIEILEKWLVQQANSYPHSRDGQNVLFGDGHASYEKTSDVGVKHDNIYTRRGAGDGEDAIRIGNAGEMGEYTVDNVWQPRNAQDSFLVNDDSRGGPYD